MRQFLVNSLFEIAVRARKSPWIETQETSLRRFSSLSGLVRARGLKLSGSVHFNEKNVRARKSPWIETIQKTWSLMFLTSGLVRARGLKLEVVLIAGHEILSGLVRARGLKHETEFYEVQHSVRARKSPWIETYIDTPIQFLPSQGP